MSSAKNSITVFFPAYNDSGSILLLVHDALNLLPRYTDDYEVIVINDGSTDTTKALLEDSFRNSPHVKIVHHETNKGYGAALITGFRHASKDLVFYTDGDGQYDVKDLAGFIEALDDNTDWVNGYKIKRSDKFYRTFIGKFYSFTAKLMFGLPVRDVDCDFRLIRRSALQNIRLFSTSGVICVELIYKLHAAGYRFTEVPITHYPRIHGISQFFTPVHIARTAYGFLKLWIKLVLLRQLKN
jgi:glycosyltransferase involved in cell wall biosynthesis